MASGWSWTNRRRLSLDQAKRRSSTSRQSTSMGRLTFLSDLRRQALDGSRAHPSQGAPPSSGGRKAVAPLLPLGIPGHDGHRSQGGMDPRDQAQTPVARVQTHHAWTQPIEADSGGQQRLSEGGIVAVGWGDEAEQGQAGAAAE